MKKPSVSEEVRELRHEISLLRGLLSSRPAAEARNHVRVYIERCPGERKPFAFVFRGETEKRLKMSETRTAIALTLLLDLEQRSEGLNGFSDTRETSYRLFQLLNPELESSSQIQEQIRVAFYRFATFWNEQLRTVVSAEYDSSEEKLTVLGEENSFRLELSSSDPLIEDALPKLGKTPMLERLRRDRFLFVPGGGRGAERFLEEIYSTPGKLQVLTTYARLQLITVPRALLKKYNAVPEALRRHERMHQRLEEGSLQFTEIIPEQGLEELLQLGSEAPFSYFQDMERQEIVEHLLTVRDLLLSDSGYSLILTRSDIPFYVGSYSSPNLSLSSFFKIPRSGPASAYSSFAVWGPDIGKMAEATLFDWLLHHPTTISERGKVARFLERISTLIERGR